MEISLFKLISETTEIKTFSKIIILNYSFMCIIAGGVKIQQKLVKNYKMQATE